ncbi:MAG: hypothetical protein FD189_954 [Elusimicrobia bacterium]|nr:MAG: hypothetical protein FD154_1008 [Elusimicrobiota bacterium]KAF0156609.1 MAG: hypothetical protein FD189_954 [Elusimicrobiota bacterium]
MRKIRKFKIPVYAHEVQRKARKEKIDLFSIGLAAPEHLREFASALFHDCEPATVFDHAREDLPGMKENSLPGLTRGVITLGPGLEAKAAGMQGDNARLAEIAAGVFLETGLKVVAELAAQEAGNEGFDMGEPEISAAPWLETAPGTLPGLLGSLDAAKIGVSAEGGTLTPRHTLVFSIPWLNRKKKEKEKKAVKPGEKK